MRLLPAIVFLVAAVTPVPAATQAPAAQPPLSSYQPPPGARLEAATIKLLPPPTPGGNYSSRFESDPSHLLITSITLRNLINIAYGIQMDQVEAPDWTGSVYLSVEASFSGASSKAGLMLLLQPVIVDKFKLAYHVKTRNLPDYELVVAPKGIKMKSSDKPQSSPVQAGPAGFELRQAVVPMAFLANILSAQTDRPVFDKTNLQGNYEFTLTFVPDDMLMGPDPPNGPNLREALQDQLGLKLQSGVGPLPVMIVDHIERAPVADN